MTILRLGAVIAALVQAALGHHQAARAQWAVPAWFYPQILCVHDGWQYRRARTAREADYVFGPGLAFRRAYKTRSEGERADWHGHDSLYGTGLQFMVGTWNAAGGAGDTTSQIAAASVAEQIYRAYVTEHRRGSFADWPNTARACGLPT